MSGGRVVTNEDLRAAISALLAVPEMSALRGDLEEAAAEVEAREEETPQAIAGHLPPRAEHAIRVHLAGYLDAPQPPEEAEAVPEDRPDDTSGLAAVSGPTAMPSREEVRAVLAALTEPAPRADVGAAEGGEPELPDTTTFLFLADPQVSRAEKPKDNDNPRVKTMDQMNRILNDIGWEPWPSGYGLDPAIEGTLIGKPKATFFGGDLCQTGGDYNFADQAGSIPAHYNGGFELEMVRRLFDADYKSDGLTKLDAGPVYFGLGNHDLQSQYHPAVGWFKDCFRWSTPTDYWRWQMWNFICQKHRGVFTNCIFKWSTSPTSKPTAIDAKEATSNEVFYWQDRSLNYVVDLGPVDVYQLHRFGGDAEYGHAPGTTWLTDQLKKRGATRPVIVVQHYDFSTFSIPAWWTDKQCDDLLELLEPYNVVAFLMGHHHSALSTIPLQRAYPSSTKVADEFRPGSAGVHGNFALVRVSPSSLDVLQGSGAGKTVQWINGYHKTW
ncbi:metallophosphoesterase [Isoptericola sediminis]|uniref:Calcineurin-like phosphoesterase domain-containing protein n=1 Tax=Isoptericola sediminis TaxID=2733572 RepID=A0A849JZE0_9MICO|nr:metallophosphoesterase [Isoptericola sediminis]NNU28652.1 hypothetical protein [Isoptericola sediminis]